jgi:hypothetical protein
VEKLLKSRLVTYILILVLGSAILVFAGDVTVQEGELNVDGDLKVGGNITGPTTQDYPNAYIHYLYVDYKASIYNSLQVGSYINSGTINCGKLNAGYVDPAGVLYDLQTRQEIIDGIKRNIAPEKQGGALVFFNKDTKRLETYVPGEGKFYDLQGNLTFTMPSIDVAKDYKTIYYLDIMTGEVKARQEVVVDRYIIKQGYILDEETGHFINLATGEIVPKETAVELIEAP